MLCLSGFELYSRWVPLTTYFVFIFIFVVLNCFLPLTRFTMLTFSFFDNCFIYFYNRNAAR